jgi:hypothetical protein
LLSLEGKLRNFGGTVSSDAMIVWASFIRGKLLVVGKVKPCDWERDAKRDYDESKFAFRDQLTYSAHTSTLSLRTCTGGMYYL